MPVSLEVAYQQYFPIVERKCARILSADTDATDIAQETFVRLWESGVMQRDPRCGYGVDLQDSDSSGD